MAVKTSRAMGWRTRRGLNLKGEEMLSMKAGLPVTRLSVIVPVYNEQATIGELLDRVCAVSLHNIEIEVIVADDGSRDETARRIAEAQSQHRQIKKVHTSLINLGKGAAIRFGLEFVTGDFVLIQDADLELDPVEYGQLLEPLLRGEANVVYGTRFGKYRNRIPFKTRAANRLLVWLTNILYNSRLTDMATGYKVFRASVIKSLPLRSARFEFEPEVTARLLMAGEKIVEVPIRYKPRSKDEGKTIGWMDGIEYIITLVKYRFFNVERVK